MDNWVIYLPVANAIIGVVAVAAAVIVGFFLLRQQEKHRKQELTHEAERRQVEIDVFARFAFVLSASGVRAPLQVSIVNRGLRAVTITRISAENEHGYSTDLPTSQSSSNPDASQCHSSSGPLPYRIESLSNYELEATISKRIWESGFIPQRIRLEYAGAYFIRENIHNEEAMRAMRPFFAGAAGMTEGGDAPQSPSDQERQA